MVHKIRTTGSLVSSPAQITTRTTTVFIDSLTGDPLTRALLFFLSAISLLKSRVLMQASYGSAMHAGPSWLCFNSYIYSYNTHT